MTAILGTVLERDGSAYRVGMDNAGPGHRQWATDLQSGRTVAEREACCLQESDFSLDTVYINEELGVLINVGSVTGVGTYRAYAWAQVIENGRVVATDFAPDHHWIEFSSRGFDPILPY